MAQIKVNNLQKAFGDFVAVKDSTFTVEDGEFFVMLGPSDCSKTTTLSMIADLQRDPVKRQKRHLQARGAAGYRVRLPALRAVSAYERQGQYRLPAEMPGHAACRDQAARGRGGAYPAHYRSSGPEGFGPFWRRPPARRARARHCPQADGLHDG